MPTLGNNLSAMLSLAGYSQQAQLPNALGQGARIINQVARMMMREARLSEQNQYLRFLPLNSPQKEQPIPSITDPTSIVTVELVTDSVNDSRADVDIVSRPELNAREGQGGYSCARFGSPTRIRFSWNPAESSDTIYIGYEVLPVTDAGDMGDIPRLPESFHDVLQVRSAILFREVVMEKAVGPHLIEMRDRLDEQWETWCMRDAEERPVQRPAFGSLDFDDPMAGSWF